ncbi:MAG: ParB/RepB/Spo0J family partition protein [Candidatus Schekmanbacteria bacterium]|nr:ParB/RepB/Spo0J family partition protein [Candidatus Schekmanbacteria bacterium]
MAKKTLGRGLDALIPTGPEEESAEPEIKNVDGDVIYHLSVDEIQPNRWQPRQDFDDAGIEGLAASIATAGILQPIVVQKSDSGYELIAGERRLRAAKKAGWQTIPAIVTKATEKQGLQMALVENIQRENLNPMEEALAYQNLLAIADCSQEELAQMVGKDRSTVSNSLRLLKLPAEIQQHLRHDQLTSGHARAILALGGMQEQHKLCKLIMEKGLSVRQAEEYVKLQQNQKDAPAKSSKPPLDAILQSIQEQLTHRLATKVKLEPASRGNKGRIVIEYFSAEDLDRILQVLEVG